MKPTSDAVAIAILAALLLFVAVNLQAGWVFGVDALLIGLLAVGWMSARLSVRGLTVTRAMAREAFEGDAVPITLSVAVRRGRRYFIELRDAVPGLTPAAAVIPVCEARRPAAGAYQATAQRRGVHQVDTLEVRSMGVAGLFTARGRLVARGAITVFPRYWPLAAVPVPGHTGAEAASVPLPARDGLDVAGVREFRDGDSLRHVHWRSTARRGALVVREFERDVHHPVGLLLDTTRTAYASAGGGEAFEDLVRAAASIAYAVTRSGRAVHLAAASGRVPLAAVTGWTQALHWLARVQPDGRLSPLDAYIAAIPAGTPVVVCSPDADAVATLSQRGISTAAVLVDVASYARSAHSPQPTASPWPGRGRAGARGDREERGDPGDSAAAGEALLQALGIPVAVLRRNEEVGACLQSFSRLPV